MPQPIQLEQKNKPSAHQIERGLIHHRKRSYWQVVRIQHFFSQLRQEFHLHQFWVLWEILPDEIIRKMRDYEHYFWFQKYLLQWIGLCSELRIFQHSQLNQRVLLCSFERQRKEKSSQINQVRQKSQGNCIVLSKGPRRYRKNHDHYPQPQWSGRGGQHFRIHQQKCTRLLIARTGIIWWVLSGEDCCSLRTGRTWNETGSLIELTWEV